MTNEEAVRCNEQLRLFMVAEDAGNDTNRFLEESYTALDMSIEALRNMELLTDRPCLVCKNHTDTGCKAWDCPFDGAVVHEKQSEGHYEYGIFDGEGKLVGNIWGDGEFVKILCEERNARSIKKGYRVKKRLVMAWEAVDNDE